MLLQPVHGDVRQMRIDTERSIGRDVPWVCEALKTGVEDRAISRAQLWVRSDNGTLQVESIGSGRARLKLAHSQKPLRAGERHVLEPGCEIHFLAPREAEGGEMKLRSIAGWRVVAAPATSKPPQPAAAVSCCGFA